MAALSLLRLSKKSFASSSPLVIRFQRFFATAATAAADPVPTSLSPPPISKPVTVDLERVKWDYRGQRRVIPLGQWVPKIAVDAYVAPNVVLAGQVQVHDGASVWSGSVLRGDLNKIMIGFCSNVQEKCVLHATWSTSTGRWI
jgi:gamma-carbonic anhydrase